MTPDFQTKFIFQLQEVRLPTVLPVIQLLVMIQHKKVKPLQPLVVMHQVMILRNA